MTEHCAGARPIRFGTDTMRTRRRDTSHRSQAMASGRYFPSRRLSRPGEESCSSLSPKSFRTSTFQLGRPASKSAEVRDSQEEQLLNGLPDRAAFVAADSIPQHTGLGLTSWVKCRVGHTGNFAGSLGQEIFGYLQRPDSATGNRLSTEGSHPVRQMSVISWRPVKDGEALGPATKWERAKFRIPLFIPVQRSSLLTGTGKFTSRGSETKDQMSHCLGVGQAGISVMGYPIHP